MRIAYELLMASIGAAGCWTLWFFFVKEYRISALREEVFTLRDQLFIMAERGEIAFDHPAYVELRRRLNAVCRFAHHISLPSLIVTTRFSAPSSQDLDSFVLWRHSLSKLPDETREAMEKIHSQVLVLFTEHLIEGSVLLSFLAVLCLASLAVLLCTRRFFRPRAAEFDVKQRVLLSMADTLDVSALEGRAYAEELNAERLDLQPA